jgi:multiple sugar transport system permease protein
MATSSYTQSSQAARARARKKLRRLLTYVFLGLVTVLVGTPVFWLLITSLKRDVEYLSYPITFLPVVPQWNNYLQVFDPRYHFLEHAGMTVFLAVTYSTLCVISSAMSGFAFARFPDVRASKRLFWIVVAMIIVPTIVTVIPQFMILSKLRLTGTYWPWVLWGLSGSPFHIFLFRQFFLSFPKELEDAAEVDGCSPFGIFWRIFLPNAQPVIATSFILNFVWVWGDWFTPLIYLKADNTTLAVLINTVFRDPAGNLITTLTVAGTVIYILPMVVVFFLGQRYILQGVVTSGLAGR